MHFHVRCVLCALLIANVAPSARVHNDYNEDGDYLDDDNDDDRDYEGSCNNYRCSSSTGAACSYYQ